MQKIVTYFFLFVTNWGLINISYSQGFSHKGTEFIIPNVFIDSYQLITNGVAATVTIENYGNSLTTVYNLPADTCFQLSLNSTVGLPFNSIFGYGFTPQSNYLVKKSIRITSSTPIYVMAQQFGGSSLANPIGKISATYPVIPKKYARNSTTIYNMVYNIDSIVTATNHSQTFVITSFQDSTDIVVKPTHNTGHGWLKDSTYHIRLNKAECFTIPPVTHGIGHVGFDSTYDYNDFSGTEITTIDPCQKLSVVQMHLAIFRRPNIPSMGGDLLFEEFPAKEYLGTTSFVVPEKWKNESEIIVYQNINYFYGKKFNEISSIRVRIYLNDGKNNFEQAYFYPMYECSKAMARDFDNDGDLDIVAASFYNGYSDLKNTKESVTYLSNTGDLNFIPSYLPEAVHGKWLTMEVGDFNNDNLLDVMLGTCIFNFSEMGNVMASTGISSYPQILLLTHK